MRSFAVIVVNNLVISVLFYKSVDSTLEIIVRRRRHRFLSSLLKVGNHERTHQFSTALPVSCGFHALHQSLARPVYIAVFYRPKLRFFHICYIQNYRQTYR